MREGLFGLFGRGGSGAKTPAKTFEVAKSEAEWRQSLSPEQFRVLREHGTERAGTSPLDKTYAPGLYRCAGCGQPLFPSQTKFDSGTGWPSFHTPLDEAVETTTDRSLMMSRTEVHCSRCGSHLGHVFDDGPAPTGLRYCMNGAALDFRKGETPLADPGDAEKKKGAEPGR